MEENRNFDNWYKKRIAENLQEPPADAWENIADELDTMEVWDRISAQLDTPGGWSPHKTLYYAVPVAVLLFLSGGLYYYFATTSRSPVASMSYASEDAKGPAADISSETPTHTDTDATHDHRNSEVLPEPRTLPERNENAYASADVNAGNPDKKSTTPSTQRVLADEAVSNNEAADRSSGDRTTKDHYKRRESEAIRNEATAADAHDRRIENALADNVRQDKADHNKVEQNNAEQNNTQPKSVDHAIADQNSVDRGNIERNNADQDEVGKADLGRVNATHDNATQDEMEPSPTPGPLARKAGKQTAETTHHPDSDGSARRGSRRTVSPLLVPDSMVTIYPVETPILPVAIDADHEIEKPSYQKSLEFGVTASAKNTWLLNHATLRGLEKHTLTTTLPDFGKDIGMVVTWHFSPRWSAQAEGMFLSELGQRYQEYRNGKYVDREVDLRYYTMNLLMKYNRNAFSGASPVNGHALVGGIFAGKLHQSTETINDRTADNADAYTQFNYGVLLGYEYNRYLFKNLVFTTGLRVNYGLPNIDALRYSRTVTGSFDVNVALKYKLAF